MDYINIANITLGQRINAYTPILLSNTYYLLPKANAFLGGLALARKGYGYK